MQSATQENEKTTKRWEADDCARGRLKIRQGGVRCKKALVYGFDQWSNHAFVAHGSAETAVVVYGLDQQRGQGEGKWAEEQWSLALTGP